MSKISYKNTTNYYFKKQIINNFNKEYMFLEDNIYIQILKMI